MSKKYDHHEKMAKLTFAEVYPHYVTKIEKKGRTKEELHTVIEWLTGFTENQLDEFIEKQSIFEQYFSEATMNPNANLITGVICGYRVEKI